MKFIGIDLGGTNLRVGVVDDKVLMVTKDRILSWIRLFIR